MFLVRPEGGSCITNTATTDNAAQKHYLECYNSGMIGCREEKGRDEKKRYAAVCQVGFYVLSDGVGFNRDGTGRGPPPTRRGCGDGHQVCNGGKGCAGIRDRDFESRSGEPEPAQQRYRRCIAGGARYRPAAGLFTVSALRQYSGGRFRWYGLSGQRDSHQLADFPDDSRGAGRAGGNHPRASLGTLRRRCHRWGDQYHPQIGWGDAHGNRRRWCGQFRPLSRGRIGRRPAAPVQLRAGRLLRRGRRHQHRGEQCQCQRAYDR
ncbi:hypothetical protein DESC_580083 [Desulfosarcina cetonica]|nr:hypothetical protein DESC_580083 [Desulfosarcina cetonica]